MIGRVAAGAGFFGGLRRGGGQGCLGNRRGLGRCGLHHLLGHAHVQAVILAIFALDVHLCQVVRVQQFCEGFNEGDICVVAGHEYLYAWRRAGDLRPVFGRGLYWLRPVV